MSINKDERNQKLFIGAVLIGLLLSLIVINSLRFKKSSAVGMALSPTPSVVPFVCNSTDQDICKFLTTLKTSNPFEKITSTQFTAVNPGEITQIIWNTDGQGNFELKEFANDKEVKDWIFVDGADYLKNYGTNSWKQQVMNDQSKRNNREVLEGEIEMDDVIDVINDQLTFQKISINEPCGNKTCVKYQLVSPNKIGISEYVSFDTEQYLLRKYQRQEANNISTEYDFAYTPITITTPSPIR